MQILEKITELRTAKKWTEYRLSEESGIPQSTISSWYKKDMLPSITSLEKICSAFDIPISQFFAEDSLIELTKNQKELLYKWNILNEKQKEAVINLLDSFRT